MVAVKIVTSQVVREQVQETTYGKPEIASSETTERVQRNVSNGGEGGIRPNTGSSIDGGGSSGTELTENTSNENFNSSKPTRQAVISKAGNMIRKINVSVVVPRSYYVRIFNAQNPEGEAPSDDDLEPIIAKEETKIADIVQPQIVSSDDEMQPGQISVEMVYDQAYLEPAVAGSVKSLFEEMETNGSEDEAEEDEQIQQGIGKRVIGEPKISLYVAESFLYYTLNL